MSTEYTLFKSESELPRCTAKGFKVIKCPAETWNLIQETYNQLKQNPKTEDFNGIRDFIKGEELPDIFTLDQLPEIRKQIHQDLQQTHEDWSGHKLLQTFIYGIRSYKKGAMLGNHKDRIQTHHISSIIMIDKDLNGNPDWALDIQDHDGTWHKIYTEPGDMILYESAVCEHGRSEPFKGEFFRNFYVHYRFKNYMYTPERATNIE